jgi:hypothetical protein
LYKTFVGLMASLGMTEKSENGAPEETRTPNLLIRSQMLYPLSYGCASPRNLVKTGLNGKVFFALFMAFRPQGYETAYPPQNRPIKLLKWLAFGLFLA